MKGPEEQVNIVIPRDSKTGDKVRILAKALQNKESHQVTTFSS